MEQREVPVRRFANQQEALEHIANISTSLSEGVCAGVTCQVERTQNDIGSWKYFDITRITGVIVILGSTVPLGTFYRVKVVASPTCL